MTVVAVSICSHLQAGAQRSYIEYNGARFCLDCAAGIYEKTKDIKLYAAWEMGRKKARNG